MKKRIITSLIAIALLFAMLPQIVPTAKAAEIVASGVCGDNLTWTLDDDGTFIVSGQGDMINYNGKGGVLVFFSYSSYIDEIKRVVIENGVTSIGDYAFIKCSNLESVDIANSVRYIGEGAFAECYRLEEVYIPESVSEMGASPFRSCYELNRIDVSEDNDYFCVDSYDVLYDKQMSRLIQVLYIKDDYEIPLSVRCIDPESFLHYSGSANIFIPKNVELLMAGSIPHIVGISVDEANTFYCADSQGVLYSKDMTVLVQTPHALEGRYLIPETVTSIMSNAIQGGMQLEELVIPSSVTYLGKNALEVQGKTDVYFTGDAPTCSEAFFPGSNKYYYPADNLTWTEEAKNAIFEAYWDANWNAIDMPNFYGFALDKDGYTVANAAQSFAAEPVSHADEYYIPRERYDDLFGKSYVDATEGLYTEKWGGNCAGMSSTAILFFLESLNWASIGEDLSEDFANPNDFYQTVNRHLQSQSYYPAIGNDTEVTRLVEVYQLYINAIDKSRLVENLDNTYFETDVTEKNTLFGKEYIVNHVSNGTYIATMLEEFQDAYDENNPLLIVLQADGFGHAIVSRTDLKPEDMGDGWWRVYVYDPNKPYINKAVCSVVSGVEAEPIYTFGCNELIDNGGDIYLELNPSLNQWRYCTSVNSNNADKYIGSSPSGDLLWKKYYHDATPENENDDEGKKNNAKIPDYFYTIDLTDLSLEDFTNPHFDGINAWIPENNLAIAVDGNTDCSIYASTGELVAIVEDGDAFVLSDVGSYDAYIGETENGNFMGGRIYLPNDVYTVYYSSGTVQFLGNDNALSFSCEGVAELTIDIVLNSLQILAQEDGIAVVKCANVISTDECSYVDTEGTLLAGETFSIAYSDENKVEASTDSKDGEFQLYQKNADQDEAVATKVIKSGSLWLLWIIGGVAATGVVLFILLKKKK